jgi:hypothetical protein
VDTEYRARLRPVDEAIQCIQSGYDVIVGMCASEPQAAMSRLHILAPRVRDVRVFSVLTMNPYDFYMLPEMKDHFELASWFHAPGARGALKAGSGPSRMCRTCYTAAVDRILAHPPEVFHRNLHPSESMLCKSVARNHLREGYHRGRQVRDSRSQRPHAAYLRGLPQLRVDHSHLLR